MNTAPPSRGFSPSWGFFYLPHHPQFHKTIDLTPVCSYNEMHFKYDAFLIFQDIYIFMIQTPGLRISSFSTSTFHQFSWVYLSLSALVLMNDEN